MVPPGDTLTNTLIALYGVPGTGKSTAAACLSMRFDGALVISTDIIRAFAVSQGMEQSVWLNRTSHDAWQLLGNKTETNVLEGFRRHSEAVLMLIEPMLEQLFRKHKLVILEGVHMTQELLGRVSTRAGRLLPVYLGIDESIHGRRLEKKASSRVQADNVWQRNYDVLQTIDGYLMSLDHEHKIEACPRDQRELHALVERIAAEGVLKPCT
ncbi:AAA family ATPase [Paenibacillus urinalis]|uniref:AAA family ATPase n=1 Tax=Paenibacillus urinalis TaxID=521520 RepID=A0AAX3N3Y2_9BACL|nr:AAA family ATPase [Paenibacillus urinalis]WDH83332.1 hypothetical protein PUW23_03550 [Paenibacillus urinalis]